MTNTCTSTDKKTEAAAGYSIMRSATESTAVKFSGDSKDCSVKHEMVEDDVSNLMLGTWKDDVDLRILHYHTLIKIENFDDKADQPPPSKRCKIDFEPVIMEEILTKMYTSINFVQSLLKRQFDKLNSLNNTLYQARKVTWTEAVVENKLQIIHCKGQNHWIVATTVNCTPGIVKVYNSCLQFSRS